MAVVSKGYRLMGIDAFLAQARQRVECFGIRNILVATLQGHSARAVREVFGPDVNIYAVGNPASAHARDLVYHDGTDEETVRQLEAEGIRVVLADQGLFQAVSIGGQPYLPAGDLPATTWRGTHKTLDDWSVFQRLDRVVNTVSAGRLPPLWLVTQTLGALLGDGPAVCLEITLMAADAGALPLDEDCMAISRPRPASHAPDTALILHPTPTARFFDGLRIKDLLLCPREGDHWFTDQPLWPEG